MKKITGFLLLGAGVLSFAMGLTSPLLAVNSRVVVGLGKFEYPAVEISETMSIPQTVARLGEDGELLLMTVALGSCIVLPVLKMALLCSQLLGHGRESWKVTSRFLERWSFLELLVLAVFLTTLKSDMHLEVHSGAAVGWLIGSIISCAAAHWMISRRPSLPKLRPILAVFWATALSSCGKPPTYDHHIMLDNLGGVAVGSSVMWKGAEIGKVVAINPESGKLKATMHFYPVFAGALRQGVVAEVPTFSLPVVRGRIMLTGGDDPAAMPLASGTQLPVRSVSIVSASIDIAKECIKENAAAVQRGVEAGTEKLKDEIPRRLDEASNAAADTLDALSKKLRR